MKRTLLMTTATLFFGTAALAAITADDVVRTFQDDGYANIEVKEGPTQIKVEASKDGDKIEVVYDKETGDVLKREFYPGEGGEVDPGVDVSRRNRDFVGRGGDDDERDDEDDESDDEDDGRDGEDDDQDEDDDHDEDDDRDDDEDDDHGEDDERDRSGSNRGRG